MAAESARRKAYDTDLADEQWALLAPLLPSEVGGGRHRSVDLREVLNAVFYRLRSGCAWRLLPHDLPPKSTVFEYFAVWRNDGTGQAAHGRRFTGRWPRRCGWRRAGSVGDILDSQSVKTSEVPSERGYDAGKKVKGHKRHLLVDMLGLIMVVVVTAASVQDRDGAKLVLARMKHTARLQKIWADGGYSGQLVT